MWTDVILIVGSYLFGAVPHLRFLAKLKHVKLDGDLHQDLWHKGGLARLSNGTVKLKEFSLMFGGGYNTNNSGIDLDLELELGEKRNSAIRVGLRKQVESGLKRLGTKKYVNPETIAGAAIKPLLNKRGMIYLKFKVNGTTGAPGAKLVHPQLGSLDDIIKQVAGDVLKETVKDAGKKVIEDGGKKLLKKLKIF